MKTTGPADYSKFCTRATQRVPSFHRSTNIITIIIIVVIRLSSSVAAVMIRPVVSAAAAAAGAMLRRWWAAKVFLHVTVVLSTHTQTHTDVKQLLTHNHWSSVGHTQSSFGDNIRYGSTSALEQSVVWHKTIWLVMGSLWAAVGPRRSATCVNCTLEILT